LIFIALQNVGVISAASCMIGVTGEVRGCSAD
jgi:hypothetical protein